MKRKNVRKGVRVVIKNGDSVIPKGATGTIIEDNSRYPFVSWDCASEHTYKFNGYENVFSTPCENLKKESK